MKGGEAGCGEKADDMQPGRAEPEPEPEPRGTRRGGSGASRNLRRKKSVSLWKAAGCAREMGAQEIRPHAVQAADDLNSAVV